MNLLVSVIIPVYQVSLYIERCLWSVICQRYKNIECIIVDDGSEDDSIEKCCKLISSYKGTIAFRIIHHDVNQGPSSARNAGIKAAKGDFVFFLDSDDVLTSDCIEKMISYVIKDDALEMVQGSHLRICHDNEKQHLSDNIRIISNDDARKQFFSRRQLNFAVWNKLLKRSFVVDNHLYFKEGVINEDLLWTFNLVKYLNKAYLCRDITYHYFLRPKSIVTGTPLRERGCNYVVIYDEILNHLTPGKERGELYGLLYNGCYVLAIYIRSVPELSPVFSLYRKQARHYGCWYVYFTLSFVGCISRLCNPLHFFVKLNDMRWRIRKFCKV